MKKGVFLGVLIALLFAAGSLFSDNDSPVGRWRTIDDETKKAKSIVELYESNGAIYGRIVELLGEPDGGKGKICDKCPGADKGKPTVGLVFVKGMRKDGAQYGGGRILDPNNGKEYRCNMKVVDNGGKLEVRGFIGFSLLGRTQYWYRVK